MTEWIIAKQLSQVGVETRLQFLQLEEEPDSPPSRADSSQAEIGSYRQAVTKGTSDEESQILTTEQERLRQLCLKPMPTLTQQRQRTPDEDAAIMLILTQKIEVPYTPPFLGQSMNAYEIACFTDMLLAIEYPLYAHVAPGQRFGENESREVLLEQISVGEEAAMAQKQEVASFKKMVSRITIDRAKRLITVTFKSKREAKRWNNWRMPMANRLLTLVDYEEQKERARLTHEVVKIDFYSFTTAVRKGAFTSRDMYWLLTDELGLQVQALNQTVEGEYE
ncbi:hypothetical protein PHMEG_0002741 [Phytophthora megakarya]|uniref:Uncharacterized protein n=1 Tax=Phytophthora megakarya TaxID=4795 RepID=A0A225WZV6_9STRA|nr:hypothetical protein PHMEG_0002741 [Phytophthora megakarya]